MITPFFSLLKSDDSLLLLYITTYCRTALLAKKNILKKYIGKIFVRYIEVRCYAMLYNFILPCGSPTILAGSPVFFWVLVWFLIWSWGLGSRLSGANCPGSCAGFGLFPGLVLVLIRAPCRAVVRA